VIDKGSNLKLTNANVKLLRLSASESETLVESVTIDNQNAEFKFALTPKHKEIYKLKATATNYKDAELILPALYPTGFLSLDCVEISPAANDNPFAVSVSGSGATTQDITVINNCDASLVVNLSLGLLRILCFL
ncbi:MAG: hypothetical protein IE924_12930, partial [Microbacterium sp.]|uniref:hypothetical protein n=1 Tax=Microbacterium sp. TaxID=51671 RepID=UPI00198DB2B7